MTREGEAPRATPETPQAARAPRAQQAEGAPQVARERIDALWREAARRLGMPVVRDDDFGYVHWDGRSLHVATDAHLDEDDTVAQLVLHEICHAITQGPGCFDQHDWGMDNSSDRDVVMEHAALRLQAHLLGAFDLRDVLFPTTVVKPFYLSLPSPALGGAIDGTSNLGEDDPSRPLARIAARAAASLPWRPILLAALDDTARLAGRARHPSGAVLGSTPSDTGAGSDAGPLRCGACAFRSDGGMCRKAAHRRFVDTAEAACARFEPLPDCLRCGACCRSAYDTVIIAPRSIVARRHPALIEHVDGLARLRRDGDHCAALEGAPGGPWRCSVYLDRPTTCRDFALAGRHCLEARRRVGLSV